jgi:flagellar hook-length control protein FliK
LPRVDAARFVGRVAKAVQTAQDRGGLVQLRLSPPELGSLRLELFMQNGIMTAAVETETPAARQVLLDHLPALRERLAEQNIRIERFDVDVRQENSGGQADPRAQQEQRQHQPQQPNSRHAAGRAAATQPPTTGEAPHVLTRLTNSELNLLA